MSLSDNIWWTRKARIRTEKRLLSNAFQSQAILFWYSFFSVAISIYYLKNPQNGIESISWIVYSILILCVSSFIGGFSFKERAALIKECYERLNNLKNSSDNDHNKFIEYEIILNACENHTTNDFSIALCEEFLSSENRDLLTKKPTTFQWLIVIKYYLIRYIFLCFLYSLPFIICLFLHFLIFNRA